MIPRLKEKAPRFAWRDEMKEKTDWTPKNKSKNLGSGTPKKEDSGLIKAGLAIAAGLIVALLAKGVKDSDYYE